MTPAPTVVKITGPYASASEADLPGRPTGSSVDAAHVAPARWEIRTLPLR